MKLRSASLLVHIVAGWSWNPYQSTDKQYAVANAGADGGNATCVTVLPQGGLTFSCRDCNMTGYQPFAGEHIAAGTAIHHVFTYEGVSILSGAQQPLQAPLPAAACPAAPARSWQPCFISLFHCAASSPPNAWV